MADIALISASTRSLTCQAIELPSGATYIRWYIGLTESDMPFNGYCSIADASWPLWTFDHIGKPEEDGGDPSAWIDLQPGTTYLVKISVRDANQNAIGSAVTRSFTTAANVRPASWGWESTVSKGSAIRITAAEFNRFVDRVFAFAAYKGVSLTVSPSAYYVTKGTGMLASEVNAVRTLIASMSPSTALPTAASTGSAITAAFFNGLKNSLNSIT